MYICQNYQTWIDFFVSTIPFFNFAIDLRALNWIQYINYSILLTEIFKFTISVTIFIPLIGMEL